MDGVDFCLLRAPHFAIAGRQLHVGFVMTPGRDEASSKDSRGIPYGMVSR
jgi:hypothetical protein